MFVFLISSGCEGVQVEELWSLDAEQFKDLSYVKIDHFKCLLFKVSLFD